MRTLVAAVMLLGILPAQSARREELPDACENVDFTATGRPVVFPFRRGISIGISTPSQSFRSKSPVRMVVWAINETEKQGYLVTCSEVGNWLEDLEVYDEHQRRMESRRDAALKGDSASKLRAELRKCHRNFALPVPPRSCRPLIDNGHEVHASLTQYYDLPAGKYVVTPKGSPRPIRGLQITIAADDTSN